MPVQVQRQPEPDDAATDDRDCHRSSLRHCAAIVVLGPERELRVVRIARSPLPGDRARCAYLERIPAAVTTA